MSEFRGNSRWHPRCLYVLIAIFFFGNLDNPVVSSRWLKCAKEAIDEKKKSCHPDGIPFFLEIRTTLSCQEPSCRATLEGRESDGDCRGPPLAENDDDDNDDKRQRRRLIHVGDENDDDDDDDGDCRGPLCLV